MISLEFGIGRLFPKELLGGEVTYLGTSLGSSGCTTSNLLWDREDECLGNWNKNDFNPSCTSPSLHSFLNSNKKADLQATQTGYVADKDPEKLLPPPPVPPGTRLFKQPVGTPA
jgi:hypothetical protein